MHRQILSKGKSDSKGIIYHGQYRPKNTSTCKFTLSSANTVKPLEANAIASELCVHKVTAITTCRHVKTIVFVPFLPALQFTWKVTYLIWSGHIVLEIQTGLFMP